MILKNVGFAFLVLVGLKFFEFNALNRLIVDYIHLTLSIVVLIGGTLGLWNSKGIHSRVIWLYLFGLLVSTFSAYWFREQSFLASFIVMRPYYFLLIGFLAIQWKISWSLIERISILYAGIYVLCLLVNYLSYPDQLFGLEMLDRRNTLTSDLRVDAFAVLTYFIVLNISIIF